MPQTPLLAITLRHSGGGSQGGTITVVLPLLSKFHCLFPLWSLMIRECCKASTSSSGGLLEPELLPRLPAPSECLPFQLLGFQLPGATVCICQGHLVSLNSSPSPLGSSTVNNTQCGGGCSPKSHSSASSLRVVGSRFQAACPGKAVLGVEGSSATDFVRTHLSITLKFGSQTVRVL